jgi:hypothetical protein
MAIAVYSLDSTIPCLLFKSISGYYNFTPDSVFTERAFLYFSFNLPKTCFA